MKITVKTREEAMQIAKAMLTSTAYYTDDASERAGYPIIRGNRNDEYIADLNARLEVNAGCESTNIWIDGMRDLTESQIADALEVIDDCIYKIDDNVARAVSDNTMIGLAREYLYKAYADIYEILQDRFPDTALIDKYNLTECK